MASAFCFILFYFYFYFYFYIFLFLFLFLPLFLFLQAAAARAEGHPGQGHHYLYHGTYTPGGPGRCRAVCGVRKNPASVGSQPSTLCCACWPRLWPPPPSFICPFGVTSPPPHPRMLGAGAAPTGTYCQTPRCTHAPAPALWPRLPNCESARLDFNSGLPTTSQ